MMIPTSVQISDLYAPIKTELDRVVDAIERELLSEHPFVNGLCEQVHQYRGKMLRPALLLLSGKACGELTDAHSTLAAVVETVHLATLVHDDVLDEAEIRRRHDTINAKHGNETAVLLGDYLISHAYHLCSSLDDQFAARTIAATTNTVCEGELMQIHHRNNAELCESDYLDIIRRKTASLTAACCTLGARYSKHSQSNSHGDFVAALRGFGLAAGTAFQIVDDILDVIGDENGTGKTMGRDLTLGKPTLPIIHCLANSSPEIRTRLAAMLTGQILAPTSEVRRWLDETGSVDYAFQSARALTKEAIEHLQILPDSPARESLTSMAEFIHRRHY